MSVPTLPQFQAAAGLQANAAAIVHGLCGAQYGDLEFDVGKSIRWTQWMVDDVHITDVNLGSPRYWIVNWTATFPKAFHTVTGVNFFYSTVAFRKEQWRLARLEQGIQFDAEDWVLFLDAHEGLALDTRDPQPPNFDVEPFKSYLYREIQRAESAAKDRVVLPFYAFVKHDNVQTVYYETPAFEDGSLGYTTATASMGTPYYVPYQGMTRLVKVRVLDDPAFDWASIDVPSAPTTGLNIAVVSYGYAHWNLQDIVPPATTTEPLSATNDDGWRMRQLLSKVRPVTGLPYVDPWKPPAQDTGAIPGPWAAADQFTPDPVVDSGPYLSGAGAGTTYVSTPDTPDLTIARNVRFTAKVRDDSAESTTSRIIAAKQNSAGSLYDWRFGHTYTANTNMSGYPNGVAAPQVVALGVMRSAVGITPPGGDAYYGMVMTGVTPGSMVASLRGQGIKSTDGVTWTNAGPQSTAVRGDALSFDGTTPLLIGFYMQGRVYWAQMEIIDRRAFMFPGVTGNYLSVPDSNTLDIATDQEVVARLSLTDWTPSVINTIAAKDIAGGRGLIFSVGTNGTLRFGYAVDPVTPLLATSTVATSFADGQMGWLKVTRNAVTGQINFYTAADQSTEPSSWTALGTPVVGVAGPQVVNTSTFQIGTRLTSGTEVVSGRIMRTIVRNAISGTFGSNGGQMVLPGVPNNYLTVPDAANLRIAGDITIIAQILPDRWYCADYQQIVSKVFSGQYAWALTILNGAALWFNCNPASGAMSASPWSTVVPATEGQPLWVAVTHDVDNGAGGNDLRFFTSSNGTAWTQLGPTRTGVGVITRPDTTGGAVAIGQSYQYAGKMGRVIVANGIGAAGVPGGTTVLDTQPANEFTSSPTTYTANTGQVVSTVATRTPCMFAFPGAAGNYITFPDAAPLRITGDIDITVHARCADWTTAGTREFCSKYDAVANQRGYRLTLVGNTPIFYHSTDGTAVSTATCTAAIPFTAGQGGWVRVTRVATTGVVQFFTAASVGTSHEPVIWTKLGNDVATTAGNMFACTAPFIVGQLFTGTASPFLGTIYRVIVKSTIGSAGTRVVDLSGSSATAPAVTAITAATGGTATVTQTATLVQADPLLGAILRGAVLDVMEQNASVVPAGATSFPATFGATVTVNQTAPNQIVQAQPDLLIWRFDAAERTGTGASYTDPRGRVWTATDPALFVANTVDNMPQPVTPDPSLAGLLVPLYDNVLRLNMRDGVWYEGGELGNIPLTWDDATKTWYPRNMSAQEWHDTEEWVAPVG